MSDFTDSYQYQIFSDTGGDYDRAVISNGKIMVEARLSADHTAHIQTDNIVTHERADAEQELEDVVEFVESQFAVPENTYVV